MSLATELDLTGVTFLLAGVKSLKTAAVDFAGSRSLTATTDEFLRSEKYDPGELGGCLYFGLVTSLTVDITGVDWSRRARFK